MSHWCFGVSNWCKGNTNNNDNPRQTKAQGLTCVICAWLEIATDNVKLFSYNSLRSATRNFHPSNRIGEGGFGIVYKGVLRDDFNHANIQQPPAGSKGKHIAMDWATRAAICLGTANGLAFLHEEAEPHIVHRDIKASNVLLDGNLQPKIGDFGLAKLFPDNVTHLSTRVAGTIGYLAPEYALLGQLTMKADIYSFGVLVLEIISGRSSSKAAFGENLLVLVEWTWKLWKEERVLDIVDPELTEYPEKEVMRFMKVALFCTQAAANQRPNMTQVVKMLSKDVNLNDKALTEPGVYRSHTSKHSGGGSSVETSSSHKNKSKQSLNVPANSIYLDSDDSVTQVLPR
ncbi:hypothetical protein SADUNF_Sadunf06G0077800 [Salix dunnii]|uniref:Protein kinase domain-containing protein n=1 Tax=Salix dunnii TaxID=1413687 RepID=A0A835N0A2_9ROSI|nr:hypothetical protein SADUNF_Sadunf06G0077800 [Salix dunnii]